MTASPVDTTTDPYAVIAALTTERDAGLAREVALADELAAQVAEMATRAAELADRKTEFDERIEHQAATVDVLRVMSASPGDKQPVFDLIVRRAVELCNAQSGGLFEYDGERVYIGTIHGLFEHDGKLLHVQSLHGAEPNIAPAPLAAYLRQFPIPPKRGSISMRAILDCQVMHIRDMQQEADLLEDVQRLGHRSQVSVPLLRDARAIGVITIAAHEPGGFSESQIALLKTFAEQAVIAITSAETYRALQTRTSDLQETLEHQTATSDVLKVISRSTFDLQPVLDTVVETAARLCKADQVILNRREGDLFWLSANFGFPPEYEAHYRSVGPAPFAQDLPSVAARSVREKVAVHIHDVAAVPGYPVSSVRLGKQRTSLGVPMLREGEVIGNIVLARQRVEPFTDRQIELVSTFADQAVIAIENTRLLTEQREALERQTATAEVLQVINASPGNLTPVFEAILEKAHNLCGAPLGSLVLRDGDRLRAVATRGYPHEYEALARQGFSSTGPFGLLLSGEPFVQVPDTAARPAVPHESDPMLRAAVGIGGIRTALFVPLRKDTTVLGYISAQRQEVRLFTDKQIALLQNFATQAVIAMENARLLTEQREALEQQTATAEVLQVINTSPGDLAPVFDAMLEKALRLCDAAFGNLWTYDGEVGRLAATCGASPEYRAELMRAGPQKPEPGASLIRLVEGEPLVHIADITAEGAHRSGPAVRRMLADRAGARTVLWVPMRKDGALLGFFTIYRTEVRPFTDKQIALLENFAAQAVIATENARLLTEQQEALERQTAMAEVLAVINAHPGELGPVFDMILEKAHRLCDIGMGALLTCEAGQRRAVATRGYSPEADAHARRLRPIPDNLATLAKSGAVLHHPDVTRADSPLSGDFGRTFIALTGARTYLVVPLSKEGTLLGTITAVRREVRPFTDRQITLLRNFAEHAVIAMENARLLTEQQEALEQQTATAEVLQVINASPGNLAPVFDIILEKAKRLCEADMGTFWTFDGERFYPIGVSRGSPMDPEVAEAQAGWRPSPNVSLGRIMAGENVVHIVDVTADSGYQSDPIALARTTTAGSRSVLTIALRKDDGLLGAITTARQTVRPYSGKQIALLQNFAAQAVIAMENARLITEQREALEQQTATAEVLQVINASPGDLAPVFDTMLENAIRLCGAALGSLYTYDGEHFHPVALHGVSPAFAELITKHPPTARPGSPPARILETKRPVHVPDVMAEEMYRSGAAPARALVDVAGVRALVNIPLVKDDKVLGFFAIYRQVAGRFSDKQIALLENFAAQAVIAMESARLLHELRDRTDELVQRQAELRVTFENMGDGVAMFDETPRLIAWNRKFQDILDLPDGVLAERLTFPDYIRYLAERGEYGAGADPEEQLRRLTAQADEYRAYERARPDGRVIEIRQNPVPGGGFVLIYADITERKRSEAEIRAARDAAEEASRTIEAAYRDLKTAQANLIQAEKMASLGQLTAGIAHEIKNPLNFVNNFSALSTELIDELRDVLAPEPLGETTRTEVDNLTALLKGNLQKVVQHGQRADGIVRSMLDHSRGSSGERRMVDLNALIDEALNLAYHGARAQDQSFNITLERDFGEGIAPIEVNPQDITRVFLNIFNNGIYATTRRACEGGGDAGFMPTLKVSTRDAGEAVEIRVRDNGTGIPADIRDKLFQPFFTTKPTGEGTGLGLSITYDIVTQQHGGNIAVDSEVADFSEFTVRLPRNPGAL